MAAALVQYKYTVRERKKKSNSRPKILKLYIVVRVVVRVVVVVVVAVVVVIVYIVKKTNKPNMKTRKIIKQNCLKKKTKKSD